MNTMTDLEDAEDSMFNEPDLKYFRLHPSVMAHSDNKTLRELSKKQSYFSIIRTLAGDLAQRDAEVVLLRRRLEELGRVFKDHLCAEHELSRLEADKTLHSITLASRRSTDHSLPATLEHAAYTPLADLPSNPFSDSNALNDSAPAEARKADSVTNGSILPKSVSVTGPNGTVKGLMSMFGGRGLGRASKQSKRKELPLAVQVNSAKSSVYHQRRTSVSSATSSLKAPLSAGPVEMNAIVETEDLPPPLTSQRDIQAQYPGYMADIYGFVIDNTRVSQFIDKKRGSSPEIPKGADTPQTSSSSIRSASQSVDDEDVDTPEDNGIETTTWTSYLKFDTSTLGSLSWLPIASTSSPPAEDEDIGTPVEMGHTEAAKILQHQLEDDFDRLQKSRTIPWEKFLSQDRHQPDSPTTLLVPAMFRRNAPPPSKTSLPLDVPPQLATLPPALRAERARLVLAGIPMSMRSQIYTSIALETLQPDPDEYKSLVAASRTSVDPSLVSEIEDDIPRTLPNNVFFRPPPQLLSPAANANEAQAASKGRSALRELLLAFLARRPEIGYCQGMNLIAGYLLLCQPTTESAFWVFTYLVEQQPLGDVYFDATLRGASIEICVLRSYIDELVPRLGRKLAATGVEGRESAPYNWFLTAYASALSVEGVYRVWDVLLGLPNGGGVGWMIRFGVALCKAFEEEMLALESGFEVRGFMDGMGVGGVGTGASAGTGRDRGNGLAKAKRAGGSKGVSIDGLIKAAWKLGAVIRDDEVKKRRKYFALKIDESALG